ncbi:hypothetical protein ACIQTU_10165 [Brevundimonas sp. NPDC090276]|uniref:hypothetical protein n=1 Tax=Brevundimonas sp. NPDC090276 TaxID=3363956 RepID=UPI00383B8521
MERRSGNSKIGGLRASRLRRDRYRKKYVDLLRTSDEEDLCRQVWAVSLLQEGEVNIAARHLKIPPEALGARLGEQHHIPPWILEALVNERLILPPQRPRQRQGLKQVLNQETFSSILLVARLLRAAEDADQGVLLGRLDVMKELPRLIHRQFEWGRGCMTGPQLYRWAYLYGGEKTRAWFEARHGLTIPDFMLVGIGLSMRFRQYLDIRPSIDLAPIGLSPVVGQAALQLLALPLAEARLAATRLRTPFQRSLYRPSVLRERPVLAFGEGDSTRLRAPLPDLVLLRVTAGLFYDLVGAPSDLRNEIAARFETYARDLLNTSLSGLTFARGGKYRLGKRELDAPDVVCRQPNGVAAVFECKARKMPFSARYSEAPEDEAGVNELVKGVTQLWRYFAHYRLGFLPSEIIRPDAVPVLLTLENWTQMNSDLQIAILNRARAATASDPHIRAEDQRPIVFASIEDIETTLSRTDASGFLQALAQAAQEKFTGWMLPNLHRTVEGDAERPYPLADRLGEVLPWFKDLGLEPDRDAACRLSS